MVPVFYALDDTRYPVFGSFLAVGANILIIFLAIEPLQHRALALSISGAMTANFLFLGIILYRKLEGFSLSYLTTGLRKVLIAALLMGGYLYLIGRIMADWMQKGFIIELVCVFFFVLSGAAIYGFILYLLKFQEFKFIINTLLGKEKG